MTTVKQIDEVEVVAMKGYKKTGFFEGLIGEVEKCNIKGFEHLYRITFDNNTSVIASWDDITTVGEE